MQLTVAVRLSALPRADLPEAESALAAQEQALLLANQKQRHHVLRSVSARIQHASFEDFLEMVKSCRERSDGVQHSYNGTPPVGPA